MINHQTILLLIVLLFVRSNIANCQHDSVIKYNVASKSRSAISFVAFDSSLAFKSTGYSTGETTGKRNLSLTIPAQNVFPGSSFTRPVNADAFFSVNDYPVSASVKILYYRNGTERGGCSGTMIGENIALTAAHCIHGIGGDWTTDSIVIAPAFQNGNVHTQFSASPATNYYIFKSFIDKIENDFALIELEKPVGKQSGWIGIGYRKDTAFYSNTIFHKFSYPATVNPSDSSEIYNGDTLYYNYGEVNNLFGFLTIPGNKTHAIPGQSGSSLLFTDNENSYYSVGTLQTSANYYHCRITPEMFYQMKNIMDNYVTGVKNETNINTFSVYPNPAKNLVKIHSKGAFNEGHIQVFDPNGTTVISGKLTGTDTDLNIAGLHQGIYVLLLTTDKGRFIQKIIVSQ